MANIDPITKRDLDEVSRIEKNMRKLIKDKWFFDDEDGDTGSVNFKIMSSWLYDNGCEIVKRENKQ